MNPLLETVNALLKRQDIFSQLIDAKIDSEGIDAIISNYSKKFIAYISPYVHSISPSQKNIISKRLNCHLRSIFKEEAIDIYKEHFNDMQDEELRQAFDDLERQKTGAYFIQFPFSDLDLNQCELEEKTTSRVSEIFEKFLSIMKTADEKVKLKEIQEALIKKYEDIGAKGELFEQISLFQILALKA